MQYERWPGSLNEFWYEIKYEQDESDEDDYQTILVGNRSALEHLFLQLSRILADKTDGIYKIDYPNIPEVGDIPFTHVEITNFRPIDWENESFTMRDWLDKSLLSLAAMIFLFLYGCISLLWDLWDGISVSMLDWLGMPIWAYIYLTLMLFSFFFGLKYNICQRVSKPIYMLGELLSIMLSIGFFLFYYDVLDRPDQLYLPSVMLIYIIAWELLVNIENYNIQKVMNAAGDFSDTQEHEKIIDGLKKIVLPIVLLFYVPLLYIVAALFLSYFV